MSRGTTPPVVQEKKEVTVKPPLTLTLESPTEDTVVVDSTIEIKGSTTPNTTVAFFTETADGTVESDAAGNFSGMIELEDGINTLTVTAYAEDGEEKTIVMDVVYDSEQ
jgi:hypothetical protein